MGLPGSKPIVAHGSLGNLCEQEIYTIAVGLLSPPWVGENEEQLCTVSSTDVSLGSLTRAREPAVQAGVRLRALAMGNQPQSNGQ